MAWKELSRALDLDFDYFDTPAQRAIFMEATYRSDRQGVVRMAQSEITTVTGWSLATVKREFSRLQEHGLLKREGHGRYRLCLPEPEGAV